jgi:hypothetical protein
MENEILPAEPSLDASSATSPEIPAVDSAVIPLDASPVIPAETSTPIAVEAASEAAAALSAELEAAVPQPPETPPAPAEPVESFAEMLSEFEAFENNADGVAAGDTFPVSVKGRNAERLLRAVAAQGGAADGLVVAGGGVRAEDSVVGTVTAVVKGGLTVDVGVRAFMPASRSGVRDAAEMEKLVGQEITCRITKLDVTDEDVVVDRRAIAKSSARARRRAATPR